MLKIARAMPERQPPISPFEALRSLYAEAYARSALEKQSRSTQDYEYLKLILIDLCERYSFDDVSSALAKIGSMLPPSHGTSLEPR